MSHDQKTISGQTSLTEVRMMRLDDLKPSPKNDLYRPVNPKDPEVQKLAELIIQQGLIEPIQITEDGFILSGHKRAAACKLAGYRVVRCIEFPIRHDDPKFLEYLVSCNAQRVKTRTEATREALVLANGKDAYQALKRHREASCRIKPETIKAGKRGQRKAISNVKRAMANAVIQVINENRDFWPLSVRQVHYRLLNSPPLKNSSKPQSRYVNDQKSYSNLSDLLTRMRLAGEVPMNSIADETRPEESWGIHKNIRDFVDQQLDSFLRGYWRDLLQSQSNLYVVCAEKMTLTGIIHPICADYTMPYVIGRGYTSLSSRAKLYQRYQASGKEKLVLLILGDFDPEGVDIGESWVRSFREDFGIDAEGIRVGLNQDHIDQFDLAQNYQNAKKGSSRYKDFVNKYGDKVYEMESLSPKQLQKILRETIENVIDMTLFNSEEESEEDDAKHLSIVRKQVIVATLEIVTEMEEFDHE